MGVYNLDEELDGLSLLEQVQYLREIIEGPESARRMLIEGMNVDMHHGCAVILHHLTIHPGRIADRVDLVDLIGVKDDAKNPGTAVNAHMKRLRHAIKDLNWPIEIRSHYNIGWSAIVTDKDFKLPWMRSRLS